MLMKAPVPSRCNFEMLVGTAEHILDQVNFSNGRIYESKGRRATYRKFVQEITSPECEVCALEVFGRFGTYALHSSLTVEYKKEHCGSTPLQSSIRWNGGGGLFVRSSRLQEEFRYYDFDYLPDDFDTLPIYSDLAVPLGKVALDWNT